MLTQSNITPLPIFRPIVVDNFVELAGVEICRLERRTQTLVFRDRNQHRNDARHSNQVPVPVLDLVRFVASGGGEFFEVDGLKICRVDRRAQTCIFLDRSRDRSWTRGTDQLPVKVIDLVKLFTHRQRE